MKRSLLLIITIATLASAAVAQSTNPAGPPNLLLLVREEIKPGEMPAHEREAMHFVYVQTRANSRLPIEARDGRLAMTPVAGNENEVMYLWAYDSFADMERKRRESERLATGAMKADFEGLPDARLHTSQFGTVARFRPDLSTNVGRVDVAQARYMSITTLRLKPGTEDAYWDAMKRITWPAREKAGDASPTAVYQVAAGAPAVTYLILRSMKSLSEMDTPMLAVRSAMGERREDMDKIRDKAVLFANTSIYQFNPRLSLVSREFAARDTASPAFWITNPQMPAPAAAAASAPPRTTTTPRRGGRQ